MSALDDVWFPGAVVYRVVEEWTPGGAAAARAELRLFGRRALVATLTRAEAGDPVSYRAADVLLTQLDLHVALLGDPIPRPERPLRNGCAYPADVRSRALELARVVGQSEAARRTGVARETINMWMRREVAA